jgi:hypothetical protein
MKVKMLPDNDKIFDFSIPKSTHSTTTKWAYSRFKAFNDRKANQPEHLPLRIQYRPRGMAHVLEHIPSKQKP